MRGFKTSRVSILVLLAAALLLVLAACGGGGGGGGGGKKKAPPAKVLYYVDMVKGTDPVPDALSSIGAKVTTVTVFADLNTTIGADPDAWDLIIIFNQNISNDLTSVANLVAYLDAGGKAIFADYGSAPNNWALFGATTTGTTNQTSVDITYDDLATGVTDPMTLANAGWGIFSRCLSADTANGYWSAAEFGNGDDAVVISSDFRTAAVGLLNDSIDDGLASATAFYKNLINLILKDRTTWLLVGNGIVDSTNMISAYLTAEGIAQIIEDPAGAGALSLADLTDDYDVIYVGIGVSGNSPLANASLQSSVNSGAMAQFVAAGGTMLLNLAYNDAADYNGPGGSVIHGHNDTGALDNAPTVIDANHEYITGQFSSSPITLTDAEFLSWSDTVHGQISPPVGYTDAAGQNLGTSPAANSFNVILDSSVTGSSGVSYAMIEYTLGSGYVMIDCMTYDWGNRPPNNTVFYQQIDYINHLAR